MTEENVLKTAREEIQDMLIGSEEPVSVDYIIRALEEMRPENIINDINHALKSLKTKGIKFKIHPATCKRCNFAFSQKKLELKIPTKCPECKSESIRGPILQKK